MSRGILPLCEAFDACHHLYTPVGNGGYRMNSANGRVEVPARPVQPAAGGAWAWTVSVSDPRLPDPVALVWKWIPPGRFRMGARGYYAGEEPVHEVEIAAGFWMLETPVTQAQWLAVQGGENPSFEQHRPESREHPVERVTWFMARKWCGTLEGMAGAVLPAGASIGLPSEAQWEYACRAGSQSEYCNGDGEECLARVGWYAGNSGGRTHPVKGRAGNAWGLYDMHGNVAEWCRNAYTSDAYERALEAGPTMGASNRVSPEANAPRVIRGGACASLAVDCRSANRVRWRPDHGGNVDGFRACVFPGSGPSAWTE